MVFDHDKLRTLRKRNKISLSEAAEVIGRNKSTLLKYENGKATVNVNDFVVLCSLYEAAPEVFFLERVGGNPCQ